MLKGICTSVPDAGSFESAKRTVPETLARPLSEGGVCRGDGFGGGGSGVGDATADGAFGECSVPEFDSDRLSEF
ncbi:MAG TPA: hypothetical protein PLA90_15900, partial [Candidatus Sumerlaeota bacterium]|nr:hypothetical protein [Candidatus Sumerlaeota bacterium]